LKTVTLTRLFTALLHLDRVARSWVVLHRVPALNQPMWWLSAIGRFGAIWLAAALLLAIARRARWRDVACLVMALAIGGVVSDYVLKPIVHRARPFVASTRPAIIGARPMDGSFPSGHATMAFAGAVVLTEAVPDAAVAWWLLAAAIGYSRVYLGVHFPLDVLGGAVIGIAVAGLVLTIAGRRDDGRDRRRNWTAHT
jgi:undecaprenyl-diphosphatase